ncbi:MAG: hypothetical protein AAGA90_02850 [Actinomycetota bacterium]
MTSDHPHNWISSTGRPIGGPTVVLDLDGVISDASHRQHFLEAERSRDKDWHGFFHSCVDDPVIPHGAALAAAMASDHGVVILTARIDEIRDKTVAWLEVNGIRHDWLILRGPREGGPSVEWKRGQLEGLAEAGAEIRFCADDDPRNVEMMRALGIPTLYVPSGYYADRERGTVEYR